MTYINYILFSFTLVFSLSVSSKESQQEKKKKNQVVDVKEVKREKRIDKKEIKKRGQRTIISKNPLEDKLIKDIAKTLKFMKKTLKEVKKKSQSKPKMMEKIITLTLEQANYISNKELRIFNQKWDLWDKSNQKGKEPEIDNTRSQNVFKNINRWCKKLLKDYPDYANNAYVYYYQATALLFLGQEKKAANSFINITEKYPKRAIAGDAHFSLGEYYFNNNDFTKAALNFQKVLNFKESSRYGWSLYKIGWSMYNLVKYKKAQKFWKKSVIYGSLSDKTKSLKDESLKDLVFAYAELNEDDDAIEFYSKYGTDEQLSKMLFFLGQTYYEQGNLKKSIETYTKLISLSPLTERAFKSEKEILAIRFEQKEYEIVWKRLKNFYRKYKPGSNWAQDKSKKIIKESMDDREKLLIYYPKKIHQVAQKTKVNAKPLYEEAKIGYNLALDLNPKYYNRHEVLEYLGDIEYLLNNFKSSGGYYEKITMSGPEKANIYDEDKKIKEEIHKRSSLNMLDAYSKYFSPEYKVLQTLTPDFNEDSRELEDSSEKFIKACKLYLKFYPQDREKQKNCDLYISEIYYRSSNKEKSKIFLWLVGSKYKGTKEGQSAIDNLVALYQDNRKQQIIIVKKILAIVEYSEGKIGVKLRNLLRQYALEDIEKIEDPKSQAKAYEDFARNNPNDIEISKLWYNASSGYLKAKSINNVLRIDEIIMKTFPNFSQNKLILKRLGTLNDKLLNFDKALPYYISYMKMYPQDETIPALFQRTCELKILLEESDALDYCFRFAKTYPEVGKVYIEQAFEAARMAGDFDNMANIIYEYLLPNFKFSVSEVFSFNTLIYNSPKISESYRLRAKAFIERNLTNKQLSGSALRYVADIALDKYEGLYEDILRLKLEGVTVDKLQSSIQYIFGQLVNLENAYKEVLSLQDPYTGAKVFYRLGKVYDAFSFQLSNPPEIDGAKKDDVVKQLEGTATEIIKKSIDYYKTGYKNAKDYNVYDQVTVDLYNSQELENDDLVKYEHWIEISDITSIEGSTEFWSVLP